MTIFSNPNRNYLPAPEAPPAPSPPPSPPTSYAKAKVCAFKYGNGTSGSALSAAASVLGKFRFCVIGWDMAAGSVSGFQNGMADIRAAAAAIGNTGFKLLGYICQTEVSSSETGVHTSPAPLWDGGKKRRPKVLEVQSDGYDWTNRVRSSSTVTITRSGSTATVSHTAHGYANGESILIRGANETEYNGVYNITYINANSYSYTVTGTPATPATGTIYAFDYTVPAGNTGVNYTRNTAVDGSGRRYSAWYAGYVNWCVTTRMSLTFDGFFLDNTHYYGGTADWDHNPATGNTSVLPNLGSGSVPTTEIRQGHRDLIDALKAINSGWVLIGNGQPNQTSWASNFHQSAEIDEQLNGVLYEGVMGESYSDWNFYGWATVLANMNVYTESATGTVRCVATWNNIAATDYKAMRLALCATLMADDTYAYINTSYTTVPTWYDEYDADLGEPLDPVPVAPLTANVWGRKYENGYVLVNVGSTQSSDPGGSTTYTGLPAGIYKRLSGTQDPTVNDGSTVTGAGINIPAWDGRVLKCVTPGVHS